MQNVGWCYILALYTRENKNAPTAKWSKIIDHNLPATEAETLETKLGVQLKELNLQLVADFYLASSACKMFL